MSSDHPLLGGARGASLLLGRACDGTAWQLVDDEVEAGLDAVEQARSALAVLEAQLLAEADARGMSARTKSTTTQGWLAVRFRTAHGPATARLRQGEGVVRHPALAAALVSGSCNVDQATVLVEVFDDLDRLGLDQALLDDAQAFLLDQTPALVPRDLKRAGQALVEELSTRPSQDTDAERAGVQAELDAAERSLARAEWNTLSINRRPDGRLRGRFDIDAVDAAPVLQWLKFAGRPLPGADGFEDDRPRDRRCGDALAALFAAALAAGSEDGGELGTDQALVALRVVEPGIPAPAIAALVVTLSQPELEAGLTEHPGSVGLVGLLDTGGGLTPQQLRRLACDAGLIPCLLDGDSLPLDVGRARRTWTDSQRRAVAARDRGCTAPGCDRPPAACHLHHRQEWAVGGNTDIRNAALLCDHHHGQVHRQGWKVVLAQNGYPAFRPPISIDPDQRLRQHHRYRLHTISGEDRE